MKSRVVRGFNCYNAPITNNDNDFIYYVDAINDTNYTSLIGIDVRTNKIYKNNMIGGSWVGWDKFILNSDIDFYKIVESPQTIDSLVKNTTKNSRYFVLVPYFPPDLPFAHECFIDIKVEPYMRKHIEITYYGHPKIYKRSWINGEWIIDWVQVLTNSDLGSNIQFGDGYIQIGADNNVSCRIYFDGSIRVVNYNNGENYENNYRNYNLLK